tara:strand:+ start:2711 stop:2821 length:111 start_codon:yes stop_codon:yes gene_type:complete
MVLGLAPRIEVLLDHLVGPEGLQVQVNPWLLSPAQP